MPVASTFTGQIDARVRVSRSNNGSLASRTEHLAYSIANAINQGTGIGEAQYMYCVQDAVDTFTGSDVLLTGITDRLGQVITFTTIRALIVHNRSDTGVMRFVAPGLMGHASDWLVVRPGGTAILLAPRDGYTVGAGGVTFEGVSGDSPYDLIVIGS